MSDFLDLNKFTKLDLIGQGAFGEVFKAKENSTGSIYAAKISLSELDEDRTLFIDLKSEVNILSQLNHPSVLKFIGYSPIDFDQKSYPVIISEYSSNGSLNDVIQLNRKLTPPPNWDDTKKLINIYGIASAMSYLHSHKIIHRDLKPANILEDDHFHPKIADFGLSKLNYNNSHSKEGFKGTPMYAAPEIYIKGDYSPAGDVYAFSMIVYELLTLEEPFENYSYYTFLSKVVIGGDRPEFNFPIPFCYANLIQRCWSPNPRNRPTFQEIVEELRTDRDFIIDTIDENEFYEFVDFIDETRNSFESNKKLKKIIPQKEKERKQEFEFEENNKENLETVNQTTMSVGSFNNFPLKSQILIISKMNEIENNQFVSNIYELLHYFESFQPNSDAKYLIISEDEDEGIEIVCQQPVKISISYDAIEKLNENMSNMSNEFAECISKFESININIKYPTTSFEKIYEEILKLKEKYKEQILISIYIDGVTNTDMKFRYDANIDSVIIGKDVQKIVGEKVGFRGTGGGSFSECLSLKKIKIPSSVTEIGDYAFCLCSSLTEIAIPSSVTEIKEGSFSGCSSLIQITIPSSITEIKKHDFKGCSSLTQIPIPSSVTEIGESAFKLCSYLAHISIPSSITSIKKKTFKDCSFLVTTK